MAVYVLNSSGKKNHLRQMCLFRKCLRSSVGKKTVFGNLLVASPSVFSHCVVERDSVESEPVAFSLSLCLSVRQEQ